jgi:hypothetical protein
VSRWADAFAALDDGADKTDTSDKTPLARATEANCVTCVDCVTSPDAVADGLLVAARVAPSHNLGDNLRPTARDDLDERVALIEYGAGVPRQWAEGYAALCTMTPPPGFSPERWARIVDAAGVFIDRWAAVASESGWSDLDAFGCNPGRPDARFDAMGLVLLLDRFEIVGIDEAGADLIATAGGAKLRFRRRPLPDDTVSLWALTAPPIGHG